jgi:hypothetical protein
MGMLIFISLPPIFISRYPNMTSKLAHPHFPISAPIFHFQNAA